jgi:two-component system phosphate regulon sensor histidine kinase PhoR
MKNYFRTIQWVAALTACSILVFQAVWVYRTYRTSEENLRIRAKEALQRSVDQYLLDRISTPVSLSGPAPTLSIINTVSEDKPGAAPRNLSAPFGSVSSVKIDFQPLQIDTANLESVRLFVAKMIVLSNKKEIDMGVVGSYFKKELDKDGISVVFDLSLEKKPDTGEAIAVSLGRGKGDWVICALPNGESRHLLMQNFAPALVSLFLILLTAGCLWYMGVIIARQRRLDSKKNDFIDNLAHELRTPVAILKSTNEALLQFGQAEDVEKTSRYLHFNAGVLDKLENGIDRLLRIRQYELGSKAVRLTAVNLPDLMANVATMFTLEQQDQLSVTINLKKETVTTDREMLKDILANLIDNAFKYSDGPANVRIEANTVSNGWQLSVQDSGIGIHSENLPLIFDKFYRVDTGDVHDVKGYGIGLSYVKQLVKQLGGEIRVNSEVGIGTTFIITFSL